MPRGGTAHPGVVFVLARVPGHLADGAAGTPQRAAQVLASRAPFLGDGVLAADALAGLAEAINGPPGKEEPPHRLHHRDVRRDRLFRVVQRGDLEGCVEDRVGPHEQEHHLEGVLGGDALTGFSEPGQRQPGHDLGHGEAGAPDCTAQGGVADSHGEAVAQAIFPPSGRGVNAVVCH